MNKKELAELALTFNGFGQLPSLGSPLWVRAFKEYNDFNPDNKLQMGCRPCYAKVLSWHILNLEK